MRRPRGGALEQNEQKPENCSRALFSEPILMTYTLKDRKCFADAEFVFIWTYKRSSEVKLGSNRRIRVKSGELVEIYPIYVSTKTFLKNSDLIFWRLIRIQTWVKSGQYGSNRAGWSKYPK